MGGLLSEPVTEKHSSDGENGRLRFGASSMQGWRELQENAYVVCENLDEQRSLFAVFEGHAGPEVAEFSARNFPDILKACDSYKKGDLEQALVEAFLRLDAILATPEGMTALVRNQRSREKREGHPEEIMREPGVTTGSSAIVALVRGHELFVANVGDSRCVLCQRGEAVDMSRAHDPSDPQEVERITRAGGSRLMAQKGRVEGELRMSRSLGDHRFKRNWQLPPDMQMVTAFPDVQKVAIDPDKQEFIVLAGGIWESVSSEDVVDFVRPRLIQNPEKLSEICEELFDHCLKLEQLGDGYAYENMTAILVKFKLFSSLNSRRVPTKRQNLPRNEAEAEVEGGKCRKTVNPERMSSRPPPSV